MKKSNLLSSIALHTALLIASTAGIQQAKAQELDNTIYMEDKSDQLPTVVVHEFTVNKDTRLGTVLRSLAKLANVNIAFSESVENLGPFRFHLNNPTPWNKLLESILNVYHLSYEVRDQIITVMTYNDVRQMYNLAKQENDKLELLMRQEAMTPLMIKVIKIRYSKADMLVKTLQQVITQTEDQDNQETTIRTSISADAANNTIIINATEKDIIRISRLIEIMDSVTKQVRIEATLVEVSSELAYELGIKWSFHANGALSAPSENRGPTTTSPLAMDSAGTFSLPPATYRTMQGIIDTATGDVDYGIIGRNFALGMNLKALEDDGKIKILSRPSLTTMDNQKAEIKSGSDVPFQTVDKNGQTVVEYKEAVLSLEVQPHIVDEEAIFMDVAITKDEPDFSQSVDGNPVVLKKAVQTRMMVLDGQTAVIGGLTKNSSTKRSSGIPVLKNIPFIGRLFSSKLNASSGEELMIFLTPRIVPETALDHSQSITNWMKEIYYDKEVIAQDETTDAFLDALDAEKKQLEEVETIDPDPLSDEFPETDPLPLDLEDSYED